MLLIRVRPLRALATVLAAILLSGAAMSSAAAAPIAERGAPELSTADVDGWLDGLLPAALEREGIVGATVSVVADGAVVTERGYGFADQGAEPTEVDPQRTLFRIGSISKLVTATTVLQLVEDGALDLNAPVQQYLDFALRTRFEWPITLRHLLSHTAGFEDKVAGVIGDPQADPPSLRDAVTLDPPEQIFEPGTVPAYSNYSNGLAAYIVERVSGRPYADYVQEEVFDAAGMSTATSAQPLPEDRRTSMSKGYVHSGSAEVPFEINSPAPAGAIAATASDMSAFMLAQLSEDGELLEPASLQLMRSPALGARELGGLADGPRMALGYFEADRNGHRILSHGGDLTAFHAQLDLYPDDDAGIFISLNSTGLRGDATTAIRDALSHGFADRYFPPTDDDAVQPTASAAAHADAVVGSYQVSRRGESTFLRLFFALSAVDVSRSTGDAITISALTDTSGAPVDLVEVEPWVWQEVDGPRRVAIDQQDGAVQAIGLNPAFTLQPMPATRQALPVIAALSLGVLLITAVSLPIGAALRRWYGRPRVSAVTERRLILLRAASLLALIAAGALWSVAAAALLSDSPPPSDLVFRSAQILTAIAALGVVPALLLLVHRARRPRQDGRARQVVTVVSAALVALAFSGLAYVAVVGGLLAPSITY
ncbi:serine hydrolase domain-containing protein [Arenivirga flava]|uniref:Beta-lactamase-related domain-containing protein n=1 Tax=Arenivirga flava TaxID=1930060 RepID=A0AA37UUM5_9MICO|nr:serine hydrolase domain-containing protein [Arenivirga flava]GMA28837.1 hypothetical protein GCM10025874_20900 [Arenivirga flava]